MSSRKRSIVIEDNEGIVSYEHIIPSKFIRVMVGYGNVDTNGNIVPHDNQNFEIYEIKGEEYALLVSAKGLKPQGVFREEDLWEFVDIERNKKNKL